MPIDEDCENTLIDIVSDMRNYLRDLRPYGGYHRHYIEPITSDMPPEDIENINESFRKLKNLSNDLINTIRDCEK